MDVLAEYADRYKHMPPPEMPWHEFLALVSRVDRFDVRDRLRLADGEILGQPVSEKDMGIRQLQRAKLEGIAWPWRKSIRGV